jgi:hypothetical protein
MNYQALESTRRKINMPKRKKKHLYRFQRRSKRAMENWDYELRQKQRANWVELVPEITFVLLKCKATRERSPIREITEEAFATYPGVFETWFDRKKIPDYSLILLTLNEAKKREWGYVAGNWFKGWRLTKKGLAFARNVERRRHERRQEVPAGKKLQQLAA